MFYTTVQFLFFLSWTCVLRVGGYFQLSEQTSAHAVQLISLSSHQASHNSKAKELLSRG